MSRRFEELDHCDTSLGELILRRRRYTGMDTDVYEVKLGDYFLMSSLFTASEEALGRLGIQYARNDRSVAAGSGTDDGRLDVVVGGLGLGYTAAAVLESPLVCSLLVVEYLDPVIEWHRRGLLPTSAILTGDGRCRLVSADFFACAASRGGFDPERPGRRFDVILVDIDHSPDAWLDPTNESFYQVPGLRGVKKHLLPGGVLGLWSNEPPDGAFQDRMDAVFAAQWVEPVRFHNPLQDVEASQTVYIGLNSAG